MVWLLDWLRLKFGGLKILTFIPFLNGDPLMRVAFRGYQASLVVPALLAFDGCLRHISSIVVAEEGRDLSHVKVTMVS